MTPAKMIRQIRRVHMEALCSPYLRNRGVPRMLERAINTIEDVYSDDKPSQPRPAPQSQTEDTTDD